MVSHRSLNAACVGLAQQLGTPLLFYICKNSKSDTVDCHAGQLAQVGVDI